MFCVAINLGYTELRAYPSSASYFIPSFQQLLLSSYSLFSFPFIFHLVFIFFKPYCNEHRKHQQQRVDFFVALFDPPALEARSNSFQFHVKRFSEWAARAAVSSTKEVMVIMELKDSCKNYTLKKFRILKSEKLTLPKRGTVQIVPVRRAFLADDT